MIHFGYGAAVLEMELADLRYQHPIASELFKKMNTPKDG